MRPERVHNFGTFFVTTSTAGRRALFQVDTIAQLFLRVLYTYAVQKRYALHAFVVMSNHVHLIITPAETLERAMQLVKGGFSREITKAGRPNLEIWQKGFADRRIRDPEEYARHCEYIWQNPVKAFLCERPEEYPYSSANPRYKLDPVPQRLKPSSVAASRRG